MGILCQCCNQANATVHLTDIQAGGEPVERHYCEACAAQEGITMKPHEPINTMIEKFVKMVPAMRDAAQLTCPNCGISFGEFRAQGLLGCPEDYTEFGELLMPLIRRAHDDCDVHRGKRPGQTNDVGKLRVQIRSLERQLEDAIAEEAFEDAARLRDQLNTLRSGYDASKQNDASEDGA